jgi:hypothetical protein
MRGGRRRQSITSADAAVWCPGGRFGPRRTRVEECWSYLQAEQVYDWLLAEDATNAAPGTRGTVAYTVKDRRFTVTWELRSNAVWRHGRLFLQCARCGERCTRLYVPLSTSWIACRRCWGLSYVSRGVLNYRDTLWGRGIWARAWGVTQRQWAYERTDENRTKRREASRERWCARKASAKRET